MAITITSPVTGVAVPLLTSPTFTLTSDQAPSAFGKQWAVTTCGGTQPGVTTHTLSDPFTFTAERPTKFKTVGQPNLQGIVQNTGYNRWKFLTRKGGTPAANQLKLPIRIYTYIETPAGVESYDKAELEAAYSCHVGALKENASSIVGSIESGLF